MANIKTVWIPADLHRELKVRASASGRTMTDVLTAAIKTYLALHPNIEPEKENAKGK